MTDKDFRRIVLALEGAVEDAHMGHADFRAHGRIFATLRRTSSADVATSAPPMVGVVMLTPQQQQQFLAASRAFTPESGAWGRAGWTRVCLEAVTDETLGEAVTLAWQNAAAKAAAKKKAGTKRKSPVRKAAAGTTRRLSVATKKKVVRR